MGRLMSWSSVDGVGRAVRRTLALLVTAAFLCSVGASVARADSFYWVDVCGWASNSQASALQFWSADLHNIQYENSDCAGKGVQLIDIKRPSGEPYDNQAESWITAPTGENFVGMAATYAFRYGADSGWQAGWQGATSLGGFSTAHDPWNSLDCNTTDLSGSCSRSGSRHVGSFSALKTVAVDIYCDRHPTCANDGDAEATVDDWSLLVKDPNSAAQLALDPSANSNNDALVTDADGGWIDGTDVGANAVSVKASDPGGICRLTIGLQASDGDTADSQTWGSAPWSSADRQGVLDHGGKSGQLTQTACSDAGSSLVATFSPGLAKLNGFATGCYALVITAQNPAQYVSGTHSSLLKNAKLCVDNNKPTASLTSNANQTSWYGSPQQISVNASDGDGSGIASVTCTGGGVDQILTSFPSTVTVSAVGADTVSCTPINNVGTQGTAATFDVNVDTQTPLITFGGASPSPAWLTGSPAVIATAGESVPASGIQSTDCTATDTTTAEQFSSDNVDDQADLSLGGNGEWNISCTATSVAGITGSATELVQVDNQAPLVTFSGAPAAPGWSNGSQPPVATGSEAVPLSGVASTTCTVDGATQTYTDSSTPLNVSGQGAHGVSCYATSVAGVRGPSASETVQIDTSTPTISFSDGPSETAWYQTAQPITATAQNLGGGSGISQILCTINGTSTPYANSSGQSGEVQQVVVQPQGGDLVCDAENNAGTWSSTQAWTFQIDSIPPAGDFLSPEPRNPTLAQVAIASDSGVASAQIRIGDRRLSTSWDPSTGIAVATLPDNGSVPNGHYSLSAAVTDHAGNHSTITTTSLGKPASVTLPIRLVTSLRVGAGGGKVVKRCSIKVTTGTSAEKATPSKLLRVCHSVKLPRPLKRLRLAYGRSHKLNGLLETAAGLPVADALIRVIRTPIGWPSKTIATLKTNDAGRFSYRASGPSGTLSFDYPGTPTIHPASVKQRIRSQAGVRLNVPHDITVGSLTMTGRVQGGFIPPGGVLVQMWYLANGSTNFGWQPFSNAIRTSRSGRWHVTVPIHEGSQGYVYSFRAQVDAQSGWPWLQTRSAVANRYIG
jgi:hypothetical protein